jgi:hypothetical protein
MTKSIKVRDDIARVWREYWGAECPAGPTGDHELVAVRDESGRNWPWYGILLRDKATGELWAVDFTISRMPDDPAPRWNVQNDAIAPFETVREFTHGKLEDWFF